MSYSGSLHPSFITPIGWERYLPRALRKQVATGNLTKVKQSYKIKKGKDEKPKVKKVCVWLCLVDAKHSAADCLSSSCYLAHRPGGDHGRHQQRRPTLQRFAVPDEHYSILGTLDQNLFVSLRSPLMHRPPTQPQRRSQLRPKRSVLNLNPTQQQGRAIEVAI